MRLVKFNSFACGGLNHQISYIQHRDVQRAKASEDAQGVLRFTRRMRDRKSRLSFTLELKDCACRVLHLALKESVARHASDLFNLSEQIHQDFYAMTAEVKQWASARY